jgi:hypothetical protein
MNEVLGMQSAYCAKLAVLNMNQLACYLSSKISSGNMAKESFGPEFDCYDQKKQTKSTAATGEPTPVDSPDSAEIPCN